MSDDFYVSLGGIAQFHQRFPTQSTLRGTSRVRLTKTVKSAAAETEYRLGNPEAAATLTANRDAAHPPRPAQLRASLVNGPPRAISSAGRA
ncbi:hypothetical protein [Streptomyces sp. CC219B]|uniref:hypothetical protein n=1 Tax=Streptomyces sp. CC219B TaxID=3044574 RepID=UPI0024A850AB|nr:hypothetical protein [Streptomyces sp. CC219B]